MVQAESHNQLDIYISFESDIQKPLELSGLLHIRITNLSITQIHTHTLHEFSYCRSTTTLKVDAIYCAAVSFQFDVSTCQL